MNLDALDNWGLISVAQKYALHKALIRSLPPIVQNVQPARVFDLARADQARRPAEIRTRKDS